MQKLLLSTIAAVVLAGCGSSVNIWNATEEGNIEAVKQAIANGVDVNAKNNDGWTPLHGAAANGHKEIVELLIAEGADINGKNRGDATPLYDAASWGQKEIAELLIAEGAGVNAEVTSGSQRYQGFTPLDYATHPDNPSASSELADLLRKHGAKTSEELKAEGK